MRKTFKFRLYPKKSQITALNKQLEGCRWVFNESLATKKTAWESNKESISLYSLNKFLTSWKEQKPELNDVHSQVLQNVQERVDLAYKAFFRRCKAGENPGFPRFKGFNRYSSMTFKQSGFRIHPDSTVYLSKIGRIPVVFHRPIQGEIKTCTIQKTQTDKWFVNFSCEITRPITLMPTGLSVGIDLGLKTYIQASDGFKVNNPKFFKKEEKNLAKVQRKFSKFPKNIKSPEKTKAKIVVAKVHERIANKRKDFCHKTVNTFIQKYDKIVHEDLNIKNMLEQKKFSKSISDASWSLLIQLLSYKAVEAGRTTVSVDPRNTSQRCSRCLELVPKDLSVRIHSCPYCGLKIDRDLNASINILRLGLESGGVPKTRRKAVAEASIHGSPRL